MKKQIRRIFSIVMTLAMLLSLTVMVASADEPLTVKSVEYGANYVATSATSDDTINSPSASSNIVKVTLSDGTEVTAADGNVLTLVVDGVQYDIIDYMENGTALTGTVVWGQTSDDYTFSEGGKFMNMGGQTAQYTYRAALTIKDGQIDAANSIPELYSTVNVTGSTISGGSIESQGAFFNSVIVAGDSDVTISGTKFVSIGDGANDFQGEGAAVLAEDTSVVTLDGVTINTAGVIRTAAAVKENGKLYIKNSVIYTEESKDTKAEYDALVVPMMKRTPFALGIEGVVRATNVLGAGQGIYSDSIIVSTGWGALSTDSGRAGVEALNVTNVLAGIGEVEVADPLKQYDATKVINGVTYGYTMTGSGYVAYADAGVIDKFNNVEFLSPDYIQIMASSTSSAYYTNSTLTSGRIAVMTQQNKGGVISIQDSTVNVADTVVQIKSGAANEGYTNVVLDNADINFTANNAWGGNLVELVESDDAGNPGNTTFTVKDEGDTKSYADAAGIQGESTATLKNGEYVGNIYNNIYNYYAALSVSLENADLVGTVSSSYGYHVDDNGERIANGTVLTAAETGDYRVDPLSGDYIKIGAQVNVVDPTEVNPVNLTVDADSTWTVGEVNYVNVLDLASADCLKGEGTVYVSELKIAGEAVADGEYTYGSVKVIVDYNDELAAWLEGAGDSGELANSTDYAGNAYVINVTDEEGNAAVRFLNTDNAVKNNADGTVSFNIVAAEGYTVEVLKVTGDDNVTFIDSTVEGYAYAFQITAAAGGGDMPGGDMPGGNMPGGDMPGGMGGSSATAINVVIKATENSASGGDMPDMPGGDQTGSDMIASTEIVANDDGTYTINVTMNGMELDDFTVTLGDKSVDCKGGETVSFVVPAGKYVVTAAFTGGGGPYMGMEPQSVEVNAGMSADVPGTDVPGTDDPGTDTPADDQKPAQPDDGKTETPSDTTDNKDTSKDNTKVEAPKTGDMSAPVLVGGMAILALACLVAFFVCKRKESC